MVSFSSKRWRLLWHVAHIEVKRVGYMPKHIFFCWEDEIIGWVCASEVPTVLYGMFRV